MRTDIQPQLLDALPSGCLVADISCGLGHALFLVRTGSGGRVYSWGNGGNGRLGLGDATDRTEAVLVNRHVENEDVVSVQCGASHSMVLTKQGKVYCWGKNTQGQCGVGATTDVLIPTLVKKLENSKVTVLAAGWEHSLVLTDAGNLYSWGCGYKDSRRGVIPPVLGLGHNECRTSPELISSIETVKIVDVICGWDHCLALDEKGKVLSWGSGQNGKLGHGNEENIAVPCYIPVFEQMKEKVTYLAAGCEHSAAITSSGQLFTWGHGDGGRLGQGTGMASFMPGNVEAITIMGGRYLY